MGRRSSFAIRSAWTCLPWMEASAAPPRTEKSSPLTTTLRPSMRPVPKTLLAGVNSSSSPPGPYLAKPASAPHSSKEPSSRRASIRSRTVSLPASFCRLTRSGPPMRRASSSRRWSSSTSGSQVTPPCYGQAFSIQRSVVASGPPGSEESVLHQVDLVALDALLTSDVPPLRDDFPYLVDDGFGLHPLHPIEVGCFHNEAKVRRRIRSINRQYVTRKFWKRVQVVGRSDAPSSGRDQESMVAKVVVAVAGEDIEGQPSKELC